MDSKSPPKNSPLPLPIFYAGPISYYAFLIHHDFVWDIHEHYVKQTFRNRLQISGPQGMMALHIPIQKGAQDLPMGEVQIANHEPWQRTHWRTLVSAYNSSPFFEFYEHLFAPIYSEKHDRLVDFLWKIHEQIMVCLQISKAVDTTSNWIPPMEDDMRLKYTSKERNQDHNYFPIYQQVFSYNRDFEPDLSILDALFNLGPETEAYLNKVQKSMYP